MKIVLGTWRTALDVDPEFLAALAQLFREARLSAASALFFE
jgi:hypothetical protein